jgi:cytochrome c biogenesis protein CcmG/thiol:disulfide interchange protein DsbE
MNSQEIDVVTNPAAVSRRPRWGWMLAWVGLAALLALLFFGLLRAGRGPIKIGQAAPDFTLTTFDGQPIALADLKGKVVVLNFWASWCKPCEQEAADLEAAWRYYAPRGEVVFLGVDWTDTEKNAQGYLTKFDITYPNGPDLGTRVSQAYRITGVPETYIIDRQGNLASVKLSPYLSLEEILAAIDPLLEQK